MLGVYTTKVSWRIVEIVSIFSSESISADKSPGSRRDFWLNPASEKRDKLLRTANWPVTKRRDAVTSSQAIPHARLRGA